MNLATLSVVFVLNAFQVIWQIDALCVKPSVNYAKAIFALHTQFQVHAIAIAYFTTVNVIVSLIVRQMMFDQYSVVYISDDHIKASDIFVGLCHYPTNRQSASRTKWRYSEMEIEKELVKFLKKWKEIGLYLSRTRKFPGNSNPIKRPNHFRLARSLNWRNSNYHQVSQIVAYSIRRREPHI